MSARLVPADVELVRRLLDIGPERVNACLRRPTLAEAQEALAKLKLETKKRFKRLALDYHPDRNGGDPEKTRVFQLLNAGLQELEELRLVERPRPVIPAPMRWNLGGWVDSTSTVTTDDFGGITVTVRWTS